MLTYSPYSICMFIPAATVGFEKTSYEVDEDEGKVHVCVGVERPTDSNCSCVIPFDISITITSTSNGLGKFMHRVCMSL